MDQSLYRFAERAVVEARQSKHEEGRNSPFVGAVAVKSGTILETAYRGELSNGEHAEFTLLERKLKTSALAGATVLATLEPCTERNPPKVCCAQRLIDRRVSKVVIGMLDPNPVIQGNGIKVLRKAGIEVEFFPKDLMAELEELNRDFMKEQEEKGSLRDRVLHAEAQVTDLRRQHLGLISLNTGSGRADAFHAIRARARERVTVLGVGMSQLTSYATQVIREQARHISFDFLMIDPDFLDSNASFASELQTFLDIRDFSSVARASFIKLKALAEEVNAQTNKPGHMQLRVYSTLPTASMVAIDPSGTTAELVVEFFLFQSGERRPRFHFRKTNNNDDLFSSFYGDFVRLWNSSRIVV